MALKFDARALKCPLLFVKTKQKLKQLSVEQQLIVWVNDVIGANDIKRYLDKHGFHYTVTALHSLPTPATDECIPKHPETHATDDLKSLTGELQFCINGKEKTLNG